MQNMHKHQPGVSHTVKHQERNNAARLKKREISLPLKRKKMKNKENANANSSAVPPCKQVAATIRLRLLAFKIRRGNRQRTSSLGCHFRDRHNAPLCCNQLRIKQKRPLHIQLKHIVWPLNDQIQNFILLKG